jgi:hypothetical protein
MPASYNAFCVRLRTCDLFKRLICGKIEMDCYLLVIDGIRLQNGIVTLCCNTRWFITALLMTLTIMNIVYVAKEPNNYNNHRSSLNFTQFNAL